MMNVVPYIWMKDRWSISQHVMKQAWERMVTEGTVEVVFCTGGVRTFERFEEFMRNKKNNVITIWEEDEMVFIGWLNNFSSCAASAHFNCFKSIWGSRSAEAFATALNFWFSMTVGETPILKTIMGMIPEFNIRAIEMVKKCGVQVIGVIPNYTKNAYTDKSIDVAVMYVENKGDIKWDL